jgi:hypothetical protein
MKLTTKSLIKQLVSPTTLAEHTQARLNMCSKAFAHLESLTKQDAKTFYINELEYTEEQADHIIEDNRDAYSFMTNQGFTTLEIYTAATSI